MPTKGTNKHLTNRNLDRSCRVHVGDKAEGKLKLFQIKGDFECLAISQINAKSKHCIKFGNIRCITLQRFIEFQQGLTELHKAAELE